MLNAAMPVTPAIIPNPQLQLLRRVGIFRHLSSPQLRELARRTSMRRHKAGTVLAGQNEDVRGLHVVADGCAKVVMFGDSGREITLSVLRSGEFFGETALLDGGTYAASLVALDDVTVAVVDREAFLELLGQDPRAALGLLRQMAGRSRRDGALIGNLALHDVASRLVRTLLTLADEGGEAQADGVLLRSRPTQQDLANMVGTCRETVSRALSSMSRRGLIVARGRSLLLRRALVDGAGRAAA
jgi:CRP-like cAMP-binding protein